MDILLSKLPEKKIKVVVKISAILCWLSILMQTDSYVSIYILSAFFGCWASYRLYLGAYSIKKSTSFLFTVLSCLFSVLIIAANYKVFFPDKTAQLLPSDRIIGLINLGICFIGSIVLAWNSLAYIYSHSGASVHSRQGNKHKYIFAFSFIVICLVYFLDLFLYEYPGNVVADAVWQMQQIQRGRIGNDHPHFHTLFLKYILSLGYFLFDDANAMIAFYFVVQIIFAAFCFSFCVSTLYQAGIPRIYVVVLLCIFAFIPYNIVMATSLLKDTLFGYAALLLVVSLFRIIHRLGKHQYLNYILFFVSLLLLCVLRTNGFASVLAFSLFAVPFLFRLDRKALIVLCLALALGFLMTTVYLNAIGVLYFDPLEAFCVPAQQIARVVCDGKYLDPDDIELLSRIVDLEELPDIYVSWFADPIKGEIFEHGEEKLKDNLFDYFKLWVKLFIKYPDSYFKAWADQTRGYWNGGYNYPMYNQYVAENEFGIYRVNTGGMISTLFEYYFALTRHFLLFEPLHSIGLHFWYVMICFIMNILKKRKDWILSVFPIIIMVALSFGTPVYCDFRYAYPLFTTYFFIIMSAYFRYDLKA